MGQKPRALVALVEDLRLVPCLQPPLTLVPQDLVPSSALHKHQAHKYRYITKRQTRILMKQIKISLKEFLKTSATLLQGNLTVTSLTAVTSFLQVSLNGQVIKNKHREASNSRYPEWNRLG